MPPSNRPAPADTDRIVSYRKHGSGGQYELIRAGSAASIWVAAAVLKRDQPQLVTAFEQRQQPPAQADPQADGEGAKGAPAGNGAADADGADLRGQMAALAQIVRDQAAELSQLRQSPAASPQPSPQPSPQQSPRALDVAQPSSSRFAKKEPRAQDLSEYNGAAGAKLDEWLQELALAEQLFQLNATEVTTFAVSRLRGAALTWWLAMGAAEKTPLLAGSAALEAALRARFQPVTAARVAREQLDRLTQGGRGVNEYIADFQRLRTLLPGMAEDDALYAFERGLRRDLAEKCRIQGVTTVQEAIALAARVGGLTQASSSQSSSSSGRGASVNQMETDGGGDADGSLEERIQRAVLNAMQAPAAASGLGAKTQTQRQYEQDRNGSRGGRFGGGRGGGGRGGNGGPQPLPKVPGVPPAVVEQRRAAHQCYRCGSSEHTRFECPNATSASGSHSSN